jgi:PPM family protein phosphatase
MAEGPFTLKGNNESKELKVYGFTDKGQIRPHNEDYFGYYIPPDDLIKDNWGSLFVVSDGVGGNAAGEVASAEAVNVLLQEFYFGDYSEKVPERLKNAFQHTAMHIYDLSTSNRAVQNMQCTLTALLVKQDRFHIVHVGDSKAFLLRGGKLAQITRDHSLVGKLVRLGLISPEEARTHPNKNILLRAMGEGPILPPDHYTGNIQAGDLFCLITDGMLEHLTQRELQEALAMGDPAISLPKLIAENNRRGGFDNMTIMVIEN